MLGLCRRCFRGAGSGGVTVLGRNPVVVLVQILVDLAGHFGGMGPTGVVSAAEQNNHGKPGILVSGERSEPSQMTAVMAARAGLPIHGVEAALSPAGCAVIDG